MYTAIVNIEFYNLVAKPSPHPIQEVDVHYVFSLRVLHMLFTHVLVLM